jgi:hypothetical protein
VELIIHDNHFICKILPTTFRGSVRAWYNNPKSDSVISFNDLCIKLVARFSTSILARKSSTELFGITEVKDEFMRVYLKTFNKEMLKVEELIELIALEALISGVKEKKSYRKSCMPYWIEGL